MGHGVKSWRGLVVVLVWGCQMTAWDIPKRTVARTIRKARVVTKIDVEPHTEYAKRTMKAAQLAKEYKHSREEAGQRLKTFLRVR